MKVIVGLLIVTAPGWVPYVATATRRKTAPPSSPPEDQGRPSTPPEDEEDEDVRELRASLLSVLKQLQKAEARVEALETSLTVKDDELRRKDDELRQQREQAAALTTDLSQVRKEVARLQGLFEMVMQHRSTPPPSGL